MAEESSQRLPARAVYELLSAANLESVTTLAQASALADKDLDFVVQIWSADGRAIPTGGA